MKKFSKILSVALLVALVLSLGVASAFAQTKPYTGSNGDGAKITIGNAAKGETYSVVKLFDATVTGTNGGSIAYQGDIPAALADYFVKNTTTGEITATDAAKNGDKLSDAASAALKTWATGQSALISAVSDGSALEFTNLPYGYYVVLTTQGTGTVTVTSTNPDASVIDKNTTDITAVKSVDDEDVYIGQTVTYTGTFDTTNYNGETKIYRYTITDTLPDFLSDVKVKSISIVEKNANTDGTDKTTPITTYNGQAFPSAGIVLNWTTDGTITGDSLYKNGAQIIVEYTAKVTDKAKINAANQNVITITPSSGESKSSQKEIFTYGTGLQKVDENKKPLAGAKFKVTGLKVSGSNGDYICTAYDPDNIDLEHSDELVCDAQGQLMIVGLPSDVTLTVTETEAPDGYNKLMNTESLSVQKLSHEVTKESRTIYYDANGKVTSQETETSYTKETYDPDLLVLNLQVENNKGTQLPSTGGIGTTIFYVVGGVLVLAAIILLVTKKRMSE